MASPWPDSEPGRLDRRRIVCVADPCAERETENMVHASLLLSRAIFPTHTGREHARQVLSIPDRAGSRRWVTPLSERGLACSFDRKLTGERSPCPALRPWRSWSPLPASPPPRPRRPARGRAISTPPAARRVSRRIAPSEPSSARTADGSTRSDARTATQLTLEP